MAEIKDDIIEEKRGEAAETGAPAQEEPAAEAAEKTEAGENEANKGENADEKAETNEASEEGGDEAGEKPEDAEAEKKTPEDELAELNEKYMRLMAEYQNFRRRTEEEKVNISTYANERIAGELLNVMDNFERALAVDGGAEGFKDGVELIFKQLSTVLTKFGVEPIEAEGKPFDPNFHNAVMTGEEEGVEPDTVLQELQKGYMLRDRVLRPSMVKVSV